MENTHQGIAYFAQTWGLVYLFILMLGVVIYALWPANRAKFERAARAALDDDTQPRTTDEGKR